MVVKFVNTSVLVRKFAPYLLFVAIAVGCLWGWQTYAQQRGAGAGRAERLATSPESILADGDLDVSFNTTDRPGTVPAGVSRIQFPNGAANSATGSNAASESPVFVGQQSDGRLVGVLN